MENNTLGKTTEKTNSVAEKIYRSKKPKKTKHANIQKSLTFHIVPRIKEILLQNPQHGDPIRKELIPNELKQINIKNLYRVELSNFWRLLYTLEGNATQIFVFILKIIDHKEYDKLFGYR